MLLELSMVMKAKRKSKRDNSDGDDGHNKGDSRNDGGYENVGNPLAANAPPVFAEGPTSLELASATDGVVTGRGSEIRGVGPGWKPSATGLRSSER